MRRTVPLFLQSFVGNPNRRKWLRWIIPVALGVLGLTYALWENLLALDHARGAPEFIFTIVLFGFIGPLSVFLTLTWAMRAAVSFERAERKRVRQQEQLVALNKIGEAVNQSLELDQVLNRAVDHVLNALSLESGEVRLIDDSQLLLRASRGVSSNFIAAERTIPLGHCVCGKSAQRGELIAVEDLRHAPGLAQALCACRDAQFRSVLAVPVRTPERVVGVIHVASRVPRVFDESERNWLTAIGQQIGGAIERAQLHAEVKAFNQDLEARVAERTHELHLAKEELTRQADALRQVLVEERRIEEKTRARIAHDLHDGVQQLIIGALFEIQAARDALTGNLPGVSPTSMGMSPSATPQAPRWLQPSRDADRAQTPAVSATPKGAQTDTTNSRLQDAQDLLRRIEVEMRRTIYALRPVALDAQGLVPALRECATTCAQFSHLECALRVEGTPRRLDRDTEVSAFRIVQEALNNIQVHAQANHADVLARFGPRQLCVEVSDDGIGFDLAAVTLQARTHLGLIGMQERAESVGGTLEIESRVGTGTRVTLRVPDEARE